MTLSSNLKGRTRRSSGGATTAQGCFGYRQFQVQSDWETRSSKAKFDVWAARIAPLAGMDFTPYDLTNGCEME
jgi:hypothetical protein